MYVHADVDVDVGVDSVDVGVDVGGDVALGLSVDVHATSPGVLCLGSPGSLAVPCLGSVCLVLTCSKRSKSGVQAGVQGTKGSHTTTAAAQPPPAAESGWCCCV